MMIEVLKIVSGSWPITVIFLGLMAAIIVIYFIRWRKQSEINDQAYRSAQAMPAVRQHDNAG